MSLSIKVSSVAEKYFKKLDKKRRRKIKEKLLALSCQQNPLENIQVKALTGELRGFFRLRIARDMIEAIDKLRKEMIESQSS